MIVDIVITSLLTDCNNYYNNQWLRWHDTLSIDSVQ